MFEEPDETRPWLADPPTVAAVLVAHNGQTWLPQVLGSLGVMELAPVDWHAVDVASTDSSAQLLRQTFGPERLSFAPSGTGFGDAVRIALERLPRTDFVWLLHDDVAVTPGTLVGLVEEALTSDDVAIVGPKIREWPSLRRLVEVGLTITGTAARETGLEPGEPDAGQHDRPRDVLAVNTAGMLVRRDAWDALGGLDPVFPLFGDDIDLGWRAASAGYRVRTAPKAVVFHAEASARANRRRAAGDVPEHEERRAMLFAQLANVRTRSFWWQYVRLFLGSMLRVLGHLVAGDAETAGDELAAVRAVYLHPARLRAARRARAAARTVEPAQVRALLPAPWLPYLHGLDVLHETVTAMVRPEVVQTSGRRSTRRDDTPDELQELDDGPSFWLGHPWLSTVLVVGVLCLVAGRGLLSGGAWHGGALSATPDSAGTWWGLLLSGWHDVGTGSAASGPAFALPLAAAGTLVWPAPGLLVGALLLLAPVLAALSAHRLGRRLTDRRAPRAVLALGYGLAVAASGAVAQGRLGTVVAAAVLPIAAGTLLQLWERPGWQVGLRVGLWTALAAAFAPLSYLLVLVAVLVLLAVGGRARRLPLVVAALVPWLLLGQWMVGRVVRPFRFWWDAGLPVPGAADVLDVVTGHGGGAGSAPWWLGVVPLLLGLLALLPRRTRGPVLVAWTVALVGLAVAVAGLFVTYRTPSGDVDVAAWVGLPALVWTGGLLAAAALAVPALDGLSRPLTAVVAVLALALPLGAGAWWIVRGADDPLTRDPLDRVPAFLDERPGSTLVVEGDAEHGIAYEVVVSDGLRLGEESVLPSVSAEADTTALVRRLVAGSGTATARRLADLGVSSVYLPDADEVVARTLDQTAGLAAAGSDSPTSRVWTIDPARDAEPGDGTWWRPVAWGVQALLWVVAIVLTAPVRRRETPRRRREDA